MNVEFSKAKIIVDGGKWLCLKVPEKDFRTDEFASSMKDKPYIAELKEKRNKRSLDANAYMWVLSDKIAEVINSSRIEVYQNAIKHLGQSDKTIREYIAVPTRGVEQFVRIFEKQGLGCYVEIMEECTIENCTKLMCYYGSSMYDSKQMSRLIRWIVEEAQRLDIETKTPKEIDEMMNAWKENHG